MKHWQTLAAASIAAVGAAMVATPASAAPSGLQTLEYTTTSADRPEVLLIDRDGRRNGRWDGRRSYRYKHRRFRGRDDDDFSLNFGFFPYVGGYGYGGYPYRSRYYYDDDGYDDSYLHCHGKKYWRKGRLRCTGRWHRHYNY